ncbi:MAG: PQQ-dependent sugar dehydrogenase [Methyloceanibacter sp.]|uniref:PQQ-dependent sugar dehydrogenase n=1 Tax=Methyloceanibacter sp. TaxID=1965321 RepID=UPI003D6D832C
MYERFALSLLPSLLVLGLAACGDEATLPVAAGTGPNPELPPPVQTFFPTVVIAPAEGWPTDESPKPAPGFAVNAFAKGLEHPRWLYVLPNGDVLVAETSAPPQPEAMRGLVGWAMQIVLRWAGASVPSANRVTLLRDADGDGVAETRSAFLTRLNSPVGMAVIGDDFYVANTDGVVRFPYTEGATEIAAKGETVAHLPAGPINLHWVKNIAASPDGARLYAAVGSNSNVGENGMAAEQGRAAIHEIDLESGASRIFASGLRNPVGLAFEPESGALWTTVNERDELGSDLVPDYMTTVQDGGFYGWPYSYFGRHLDPRAQPQRPDLVAKAIVPDYALGPHTASLGLAFYDGELFPERYRGGAFVGQHGSWNRRPVSGYKVIFVPFEDGRPSGPPEDILTGFLSDGGDAYGRPVGVAVDKSGALLVADDVGNTVWRVVPDRARPTR